MVKIKEKIRQVKKDSSLDSESILMLKSLVMLTLELMETELTSEDSKMLSNETWGDW